MGTEDKQNKRKRTSRGQKSKASEEQYKNRGAGFEKTTLENRRVTRKRC